MIHLQDGKIQEFEAWRIHELAERNLRKSGSPFTENFQR